MLDNIYVATTIGVDEDMVTYTVETNTVELEPTTFKSLLEDAWCLLYDDCKNLINYHSLLSFFTSNK